MSPANQSIFTALERGDFSKNSSIFTAQENEVVSFICQPLYKTMALSGIADNGSLL